MICKCSVKNKTNKTKLTWENNSSNAHQPSTITASAVRTSIAASHLGHGDRCNRHAGVGPARITGSSMGGFTMPFLFITNPRMITFLSLLVRFSPRSESSVPSCFSFRPALLFLLSPFFPSFFFFFLIRTTEQILMIQN